MKYFEAQLPTKHEAIKGVVGILRLVTLAAGPNAAILAPVARAKYSHEPLVVSQALQATVETLPVDVGLEPSVRLQPEV